MELNDERIDTGGGRTGTYRRPSGLAVLIAVAAFGLAACGGSGTPHVASLSSGSEGGTGTDSGSDSGSSASTSPKGNPTALLDKWATCMRSHGDPNQADPTIDAHGVINITIPTTAVQLSGAVHAGADPCNQYVAAAQRALRAAHPVAGPPDQAKNLKYVSCMRANGVPKYPYPTGNSTNFNGTGVDPNSPLVQRVNRLCGKQLGLPAWWINGWGPPGDVVVSSGGPNGGPPPNGVASGPRPATAGNAGSGNNPGSGTDG